MNTPQKYYLIAIILILATGLALGEVIEGNDIPIFFPFLVMMTAVMLIINSRSALARFQNKVMILASVCFFLLTLLYMQGGP